MNDLRGRLRDSLRLMVITDRRLAGPGKWLAAVEAALESGATAVQLRDKQAASRELLAMARDLRDVTSHWHALFIVNDRFDLGLGAEADGVHLGPDDLPVDEVRRVVPRHFLIGYSTDTEDDARRAAAAGADYLGVGSVFGTATKSDVADERIGTEQLARVAQAVSIPVVGIGGVNQGNASRVTAAGAAGVAVVSAVMGAEDPARATRAIRTALDSV